MGLQDQILEQLGGLTKKYGLDASQAKGALDKIVPFLKDKLGGHLSLPGRGQSLVAAIKQQGLADYARDPAKLASADAERLGGALVGQLDGVDAEEVARASGVDVATVRKLLPAAAVATAGAMDADGALEQFLNVHEDVMARIARIQEDAKKQ